MKLLGSFKFLPRSSVGIDIGTSSLKVVELSRWGSRKTLKNYGEIQASRLYDKPFRTFEKNTLMLSSQDIARGVRAICQEAKIETKEAVFSIPDFSSFFTYFELPAMSKEELPQAVQYEARKHVPLPFAEVTFDWQVIEKPFPNTKRPFKILLVAVPNEVINQYQEIAQGSGLRLLALEAEVFGLIRSFFRDEKFPAAVLDIGAQTTTINVVWKGQLRNSHGIDIAGNGFTERISQSLLIDFSKAQALKSQKGLLSPDIVSILSPLIDMIVTEVQNIAQSFEEREGTRIEKIVLGGGSARMPGLKEYFEKNLVKEVEILDPFSSLFVPPILEQTLQEMGPSYAVAVGMALRGLE
jgi:type IV pilus assembly protein PilM